MKVLIACEFSGIVRDAFLALGHDAWSCDLLPTERPGPHIQGDVLAILDQGWDLMIAHPPCTYFAAAGLQYLKKQPGRLVQQQLSAEFARQLACCDIPRRCIENPVGQLPRYIGPYVQIVRMWQFGHADAQKPTCLWLWNLPALIPTKIVTPLASRRYPNGKVLSIWRSKRSKASDRSVTFQGLADAMASQWGSAK